MKYLIVVFTLVAFFGCGGAGKETESNDSNEFDFEYDEVIGAWESDCFFDDGSVFGTQIIHELEGIGLYEDGMQIWLIRRFNFDADGFSSNYYFHTDSLCSDDFGAVTGLNVIFTAYSVSGDIESINFVQTYNGYDAIEVVIPESAFVATEAAGAIGVSLIDGYLYLVRENEIGQIYVDFDIRYSKM